MVPLRYKKGSSLGRSAKGLWDVITSYSIHYTKLYETLGFGIIMKVVFDNADSFLPELGGARGMTGIAKMTTIPWVIFFLLASLLVVRNTIHSSS